MALNTTMDEWLSADLPALDIQLDQLNPRIDPPLRASQSKLRELLVEHEDIVGLVIKIIRDGILPAESIIVVEENGGHVVVEGNRRVCACQVLLDPSLRPAGHKRNFPTLPDGLRERIVNLKAVVAPSRQAAERTITRKHTEPGVKQWSPVAKQRRVARLLEAGRTVEEIAEQFSMQPAPVARLARDYNLLKHIRRLKCWSAEEKRKLDDPNLKVNPFTRLFQLRGGKERLRISFDNDGSYTSSIDAPLLDEAMERIAREMLFGGEDSFNTRAKPDEVFKKVFSGNKDLEALLSQTAPRAAQASEADGETELWLPPVGMLRIPQGAEAVRRGAQMVVRRMEERTRRVIK